VEDEARLLSEGGHDVHLFAPSVGQPSGVGLVSVAAGTVWSKASSAQVRQRIDEWKPDVVHCHNLFPALSPAVLRVARDGPPLVLTLHNYRLLCLPATFQRDGRLCEDCLHRAPWPGIVHRCYQDSAAASAVLASSILLHRAIGSFDRIRLFIAISEFVRAKHVEGGLSPGRIVVKPHFSWEMERREGPGEYFLYLGRLSPEKGVSTIVDAWRTVPSRLLIVGDGPAAGALRANAPPNVEFRGPVGADQVPDLLRRARAVLAPSIAHEGAGRVVVEAYAAGVPVLVSRSGGLPEIVQDGATGMILPPGDTAAWGEAARRLLEDAESERMGRVGWETWVRNYTPERALIDLQECYRKAMDDPDQR